jgi:hypothetical protein
MKLLSRRRLVGLGLAVTAGAVALAVSLGRGPSPEPAIASSHAEAPLISQDPRADNTDLYAFVSPDRPGTVTIVANYIPLEAPASGPNFYSFDDTVLYEINIDNNGDSVDDLSYQFRFKTQTRNPNTFLYNTGPISSLGDPAWNRPQTYSVTVVRHGPGQSEHATTLGTNIPTPPDNVGRRSTPNYTALADAAVTSLPGGVRVFAGQRDDPFFVDLGSVFDLAGLRPFNMFHAIPLGTEAGRDALHNYGTHSIAIQVPIDQLVKIPIPTIGIYASASRTKVRVLGNDDNNDDNNDNGNNGSKQWVQVSRLGLPLVNEVVIPLGQKDRWNASEPQDDATFENRYLTPEVAHLENALYGSALVPVQETGRTDLSTILLTGVPGLNFTGPRKADLLRLNTSLTPDAGGACYHPASGHPPGTAPSRLGVLDGDLCGFPNGRRLADDVVDIELRAFAQGYGSFLNTAFGLPNKTPNNLLGDGVDANDKPFLPHFPYVAPPASGYDVP